VFDVDARWLAVVPVLVGPLQTLLALVPALGVAALAIFLAWLTPQSLCHARHFLRHQKLFAIVLAISLFVLVFLGYRATTSWLLADRHDSPSEPHNGPFAAMSARDSTAVVPPISLDKVVEGWKQSLASPPTQLRLHDDLLIVVGPKECRLFDAPTGRLLADPPAAPRFATSPQRQLVDRPTPPNDAHAEVSPVSDGQRLFYVTRSGELRCLVRSGNP